MADLLAVLIEVTSVSASGRQIKKPIEVPRPDFKKAQEESRRQIEERGFTPASGEGERAQAVRQERQRDAAFKKGIGVLAQTARKAKR